MGETDRNKRLMRLKAWYEREMPRLFNYVSYRVGDETVAEDLTAAICERALTRLHQYNPDRGELGAWMYGIAHNMLRNHYRSIQRNPAPLSLDSLPDVEVEDDSPEAIYETSEAFRQIVVHLHQLPEIEQEVIALRHGAGLSYQEIAQVTGLTINHVGVALHRALEKLRQAVLSNEEVHNG